MVLRKHFNRIFDSLLERKERETDFVKKRNDRLRYIQKELNVLDQLNGAQITYNDDYIVDPEYLTDEKPNTIIEVGNN